MIKKLVVLTTTLLCISAFCNAQNTTVQPDDRGYVVRLGQMAPDFTIEFTDGTPSKKLSDFRGQVVMLQFTASWCSVCIKEMPHIEEQIWKVYKSKGLQLFGVDRKEPKETVIKFAERMKITYPLIMDEQSEIFSLYAHPSSGVTRNVLIDKSGKIVFMTRLYDEKEFKALVKKISEIL
jgi:peroxiredoxin